MSALPNAVLWTTGLILVFLAPLGASAQGVGLSSEPVPLPLLATPPRVDGVLADGEWRGATLITLAYETSPAANGPSPVATQCHIARDADRMYVGCRAHDPDPDRIRAQYLDRDQSTADDRILMYLDPFDDAQRAFVFSVSALGVQTDGVFDQARGDLDNAWNTIWASAGRITATGYEIEFAIPFHSLRFPVTEDGTTPWRFFFERQWPRTQVYTLRSARYDQGDPCRLCYAEYLEPGQLAPPAFQLEATPTLTASNSLSRSTDEGPLLAAGLETDVGLDLRWSMSSQSALNVTVNPDFSQVEADALQLVSNTRFALFVPERRPFFLESAEAFQSPLPVVFTRSIVDPVAGAKLAGRLGPWTGGALYARDAATNLLIPGSFGSTFTTLDSPSDAMAGRVTRTSESGNVVGAILTHRTARDYQNSVAGFDAFVRPVRGLQIRGQLLGSTTKYPEGTPTGPPGQQSLLDHALQVDARYGTRNWGGHARVESIGPDFRADLGFLPQVDTRRLEGSVTRHFWGDDTPWLTQFESALGTWHIYTQDGRLKERGVWTRGEYVGPAQTSIAINPFWLTEGFAGREFGRAGVNMSLSMAPTEGFRFVIRGRRASVIDYANVRLASEREVGGESSVRLGRRISLDLSASRNTIRHEGALVSREGVLSLRSFVGLSPHVFVSFLGQARRLERGGVEPGTMEQPTNAFIETQAFVSYRRDGQTAAFLGYSDLSSDRAGQGFQRRSLTWFFKVAYAWRP